MNLHSRFHDRKHVVKLTGDHLAPGSDIHFTTIVRYMFKSLQLLEKSVENIFLLSQFRKHMMMGRQVV